MGRRRGGVGRTSGQWGAASRHQNLEQASSRTITPSDKGHSSSIPPNNLKCKSFWYLLHCQLQINVVSKCGDNIFALIVKIFCAPLLPGALVAGRGWLSWAAAAEQSRSWESGVRRSLAPPPPPPPPPPPATPESRDEDQGATRPAQPAQPSTSLLPRT